MFGLNFNPDITMLFSKSNFLRNGLSFLVFLLLLNPVVTFGQPLHVQLKGTVIDESSLPLPFSQLGLKRSTDSVTVQHLLSDEKGNFLFTIHSTGKYFVEAKMMGYSIGNSKVFEVLNNETIDLGLVQLRPEAKQLGTVNVISALPFVERKADKIVINLNGIGAGAPIMDVMNQLPGVTVTPDDRLSLNGRNVQIYIDGKATTLSADALVGMLRGISSSSVQKVELIAQPSAKYDAAGNGGIINIIRKKNYKAGLNGNVYSGVGKGQYGKVNGGLNLNYKGKAYNVLLTMDYNDNRYFNNSDITSTFLDPAASVTGISVSKLTSVRKSTNYTPNLGLDLYLSEKTTLSASIKPGYQLFEKDTKADIRSVGPSGNFTAGSNFLNLADTRSTNFSSGVRLQRQIDTAGRQFSTDFDYYRYSNINAQDNRTIDLYENGNIISEIPSILKQDRVFDVYALKMDYTHPMAKGKEITMGVKTSYVVSDNSNKSLIALSGSNSSGIDQSDTFLYRENISAAYITYARNAKKFSYQLGLRGEHTWGKGNQQNGMGAIGRNYFNIFPSFHGDYKISKNHSLSLGLNKRIERPGYENLNPLERIISSSNLQQGNPNLLPVQAYNAEFYYSYKNDFWFGLTYSLSLDDFTSISVPLGNGVVSVKPGNADYSGYKSAQMAYNKQVLPYLFTSTVLTLSRRSFKGELNGALLQNDGITALSATSYNSFSLTKNFSISVLFNYRGKSMERNIVNNPYTYLTAGTRYSFLSKKAYVQLNFVDIFKSYKNIYQQNSGPVMQLWQNQFETRMVKLNMSYSFGGTVKNIKKGNGAEEERKRTNLNEN
jgi:outer membrane receptor protein involved in Fe transport